MCGALDSGALECPFFQRGAAHERHILSREREPVDLFRHDDDFLVVVTGVYRELLDDLPYPRLAREVDDHQVISRSGFAHA